MVDNLFCCLVAQSYPTLCNAVDCSTPGFPAHHHLPAFAQTHVHWVGDAILPLRPLSSPSPAFSLFQYPDLFERVGSSHQVAEVLSVSFSISPSSEYSGLILFTLTYSRPHIMFSLALIHTFSFMFLCLVFNVYMY